MMDILKNRDRYRDLKIKILVFYLDYLYLLYIIQLNLLTLESFKSLQYSHYLSDP